MWENSKTNWGGIQVIIFEPTWCSWNQLKEVGKDFIWVW